MSEAHAHAHPHAHDPAPAHVHRHAQCDRPDGGDSGADDNARDRRRLYGALALTGSLLVAEVIGAFLSGSLALLGDAGHMLTDVSAQVISLFALLLAARPADARRTYGYRRLEILAALANGVLLGALSIVMVVTATRRLDDPPAIETGVLFGVALAGLVGNLLAARLLHGSHSLNVRGAYLHILSDLLSSAAVVVGAIIMWARPGLWIVDPVLGCLIGAFVLVSAWRLVREAAGVLLESVPAGVDLEAVRRDLCALPGVLGVHDLHVWTVGASLAALSAHVVVADAGPAGHHDALLRQIDELLRHRHRIHHSTVQVESPAFAA